MRQNQQDLKNKDRERTIGEGNQQSKPTDAPNRDAQGRPNDRQQGEKEMRKQGFGEEQRRPEGGPSER